MVVSALNGPARKTLATIHVQYRTMATYFIVIMFTIEADNTHQNPSIPFLQLVLAD